MRRFFLSAEQLQQAAPIIKGPDAHHIKTVLRLRRGDVLELIDGQGGGYQAKIVEITASQVKVVLLQRIIISAEPALEIALAQALLKEKKMDMLVRQLTELGVMRWIPFVANRSVVQPDEKRMQKRYLRWQKISREAVKQCRRAKSLIIEPVVTFEQALELAEPYDHRIVFWENEPLGLDLKRATLKKVFAMIGPEGGFEEQEIAAARSQGFYSVGLGPRILRAETAALAAAVMIQMVTGDMR